MHIILSDFIKKTQFFNENVKKKHIQKSQWISGMVLNRNQKPLIELMLEVQEALINQVNNICALTHRRTLTLRGFATDDLTMQDFLNLISCVNSTAVFRPISLKRCLWNL